MQGLRAEAAMACKKDESVDVLIFLRDWIWAVQKVSRNQTKFVCLHFNQQIMR